MRQPRVGLVYDERLLEHDPGPYRLRGSGQPYPFAEPVPHPSNRWLVERTYRLLSLTGLLDRLTPLSARAASQAELLTCHTADYLALVAALSEAAGGETGQNARIGAGGEPIARLAAGAAITAIDAVLSDAVDQAFALIRPAGHHAMPERGMGFCIYNNIAIAAHHARRRWGLERIAIVDWDVHSGNGTQAIFADTPQVLFCSLHQDELYPRGWGGLDQIGQAAGRGYTINLPLPAGTGDAGYRAAVETILAPILQQFRPQLILVSAGQDASNADPLGRMCLTTDGFRWLTARLQALAAASGARLAMILEGGYAEYYAPYCTLAIIETLVGCRTGFEEPFPPDWIAAMPPTNNVSRDLTALLTQAVAQFQPFWSALGSIDQRHRPL